MKKFSILTLLILITTLVVGQSKLLLKEELPITGLDQQFQDYKVYTLNFNQLNSTQKSDVQFAFSPAGQNWNINLQKNDLRGPNFKLTQFTDNGIIETSNIEINTYKGSIQGKSNSEVRLSVNKQGQITGYFNDGTSAWYIEPVPTHLSKSTDSHLFFNTAKAKSTAHSCGSHDNSFQPEIEKQVQQHIEKGGNTNCLVLDLALDADYEYYQHYGDNTVETIMGIINEVEGVYDATFGLTFEIPSFVVWQTTDPYPDSVNTSGFILTQFKNYYEANMATIERDLAHQFTGKQMDGISIGIAFTDSYCSSPNFGYGLSQRIGSFAYGQYVLTAHEIGHNLGAEHNDSENCSSTGSIMCSGVQLGAFYFSQNEIAAINTKLNASTACTNSYCTPIEFDTIIPLCNELQICWTTTGTPTQYTLQRRSHNQGNWVNPITINTSNNCHTFSYMYDGHYQFRVRETAEPDQSEFYTYIHYNYVADAPAAPIVSLTQGNNCTEDVTINWNNNGQICDVEIKGPRYLERDLDVSYTSTTFTDLKPGLYKVAVKYDCTNAYSNWVYFEVGAKVEIDLKVLLEGPFELQNNSMRNSLQQLNLLTYEEQYNHPYNRAPWNHFEDSEDDLGEIGNYLPNSVDWVLLSFRFAPADGSVATKSDEFFRKAGILMADGSIDFYQESQTSPDHTNLLYFASCHLDATGEMPDVFVMVEHRNHLPILSPVAIPTIADMMHFDFTIQDSYNKNGTIAGQKNLGTVTQPKYAMYGGNGRNGIVPDEYYDINGPDKSAWSVENGTFGFYLDTDYNMDGDVSGPDKTVWFRNNGTYTLID